MTLFVRQRLEDDGVEQLYILLAHHETAAGQVRHMRVVADTQATRQLLDVILNRKSWCAPSPDVGASAGTLGKIDNTELLDEVLVLHFLPKLLRKSLLVDVEEVESRGYGISSLTRTIVKTRGKRQPHGQFLLAIQILVLLHVLKDVLHVILRQQLTVSSHARLARLAAK